MVRGTRAFFLLAGMVLLVGCTSLPIAWQSRNVAARLGLPSEEIAAVVRQASAAHRLDAHWVTKEAADSIEIGMGAVTTSLSVVFQRVDGRWDEVPGSRRTWSASIDLPTPPAPPSY